MLTTLYVRQQAGAPLMMGTCLAIQRTRRYSRLTTVSGSRRWGMMTKRLRTTNGKAWGSQAGGRTSFEAGQAQPMVQVGSLCLVADRCSLGHLSSYLASATWMVGLYAGTTASLGEVR